MPIGKQCILKRSPPICASTTTADPVMESAVAIAWKNKRRGVLMKAAAENVRHEIHCG
jgi:hypothetical protein